MKYGILTYSNRPMRKGEKQIEMVVTIMNPGKKNYTIKDLKLELQNYQLQQLKILNLLFGELHHKVLS